MLDRHWEWFYVFSRSGLLASNLFSRWGGSTDSIEEASRCGSIQGADTLSQKRANYNNQFSPSRHPQIGGDCKGIFPPKTEKSPPKHSRFGLIGTICPQICKPPTTQPETIKSSMISYRSWWFSISHVFVYFHAPPSTTYREIIHKLIWMFPKIVVPPNHPILIGFSIINPSILGYPYFWNPPYISAILFQTGWLNGNTSTIGKFMLDRHEPFTSLHVTPPWTHNLCVCLGDVFYFLVW